MRTMINQMASTAGIRRLERLTPQEWDMIYRCLAFIEAGEIDGGPLEGDDDEDTAGNVAVFKSAMQKVAGR